MNANFDIPVEVFVPQRISNIMGTCHSFLLLFSGRTACILITPNLVNALQRIKYSCRLGEFATAL